MGAYLSSPVTDKETKTEKNNKFHYGVAAMQGWRISMEDAHVAALNFDGREDVAFFGVYDGHGGAQVAKFCAMHMPDELLRNAKYKQGDIAGALKGTYLAIDERLRLKENAELLNQLKAKSNNEGSNGFGVVDPVDEGTQGDNYTGPAAGCTAVVAVIHGNKLYVANAGDSRCVLCRGKETVSLTEDHKPTNPDEERRIKAAGGFVSEGRINGGLNLSRAIGDMNYKTAAGKSPEEQIVTADPDIRVMELKPEDKFLILACDGIWDMLTNDQAVAFVDTRLQQNMDPSKICSQMCDHCLATHTQGIGKGCDNMSAMVVVLNRPASHG